MNITGVIAEYNPLHNGHAFHLRYARKETNADYLIAVMSGNFVQRGAPALLDKFVRTQAALLAGADLVIELPPLWSCASAEYFAGAGIALLGQLGCVSALCYGCETPDSSLFHTVCACISHGADPGSRYSSLIADYQKKGDNFALAREKTVLELLSDCDASAIMELFENPNNTLALEYQKAIALSGFPIDVYPIQRQGQGYHSKDLSDTFVSATAIRRFLADSTDSAHTDASAAASLSQVMPPHAYDLLCRYQNAYPLLFEDDCSQMLHYALLKNMQDGFDDFADCTRDISNKICGHLDAYAGFSDFSTRLKSKDLTYTRISRTLLHILLNIRQDDYEVWKNRSYIPYARVLGFRKESRRLLGHVKKHTAIPLLTRAAEAKKVFSKDPQALSFFQKHLFADSVYRALVMEKGGNPMRNEYRQPIIIV